MADAVKIPRIFHVTNQGNNKWGHRYDGVLYELEPGQTIRVTSDIAEHLLAHSLMHPDAQRGPNQEPQSFLLLEEQELVLGGPVQKLVDDEGKEHKTVADLIKAVRDRTAAMFAGKKAEGNDPGASGGTGTQRDEKTPEGGDAPDAPKKDGADGAGESAPKGSPFAGMSFNDLKALAVAQNINTHNKNRLAIEQALLAKQD